LPEIASPAGKPSRVVAVTGSAGVGKSTLVGRLIDLLRARGITVAVLASDPESPVSGGALLGDRFRMQTRPDDEGVFIRSLAAKPGHGVVADHLDVMIQLLEAFPFEVILIETVGAGQGDTAVRALADVVVLLLQPETGDDLQWEKAGILEVADIIAIHKADLAQAEQVEAQVRATLNLSPSVPEVLRVSSKTGDGVVALWTLIGSLPLRRMSGPDGSRALVSRVMQALQQWLAAAQAERRPDLAAVVDQWREGSLAEPAAVQELLQLFIHDYTSSRKDVMVRGS
jgi:LAO/AO transport system ATPase